MFETTGLLDKPLFEELGNQIIPDFIRILLKFMILLGFVAGGAGLICVPFKKFSLVATSLLLTIFCFAFGFCYQWYLRKHYMKWNLKCILETTNAKVCCCTTSYQEDGAHIINHATGASIIMNYDHFKKLVETKNYFYIFTKIQFLVTYKNGLDQDQTKQFVPFIKSKCPKIKLVKKPKQNT